MAAIHHRVLAESLGVSRGTVTEAYEQLMAEGCLDAQPCASIRVAATLHQPNTAEEGNPRTKTRTVLDIID